MQASGASRRENAEVCLRLEYPRFENLNATTSHSPVSSSGLTGRSSIPEMPTIEPISRGVLGPPLSRRTTVKGGAASVPTIGSYLTTSLHSGHAR